MREKAVEAELIKQVKNRGGICWKWVSPSMTGVPDRICIFPGGSVLFIEVKRPGGTVSEKQRQIHEKLRALGCKVLVLSSIGEVIDAIQAF